MESLTSKPRIPFRTIVSHGWWPSFLKVAYYRLRGYRLGRNVRLAFGSVIIGGDVVLGEGTHIGLFAVLRGDRLHLGKRVKIGALCFLDSPLLSIGDDTKFNEQVYVGGLQGPASSLTVGRQSQIQQMTFINPAVSVTIGDNTSIGGHCLIFGHQSWLSILDGYPVDFRPIDIGSNVGVAWRVFIGPGAVIGDGAMIGTNSLVNRVIPPRCLAMGTPAKVVAREPYFPRKIAAPEKAALLKTVIENFQEFLSGHGLVCELSHHQLVAQPAPSAPPNSAFSKGLLKLRCGVADRWSLSAPSAAGTQVVCLSLVRIGATERDDIASAGALWLDVESGECGSANSAFGAEVVQFLRRFGIRFNRIENAAAEE